MVLIEETLTVTARRRSLCPVILRESSSTRNADSFPARVATGQRWPRPAVNIGAWPARAQRRRHAPCVLHRPWAAACEGRDYQRARGRRAIRLGRPSAVTYRPGTRMKCSTDFGGLAKPKRRPSINIAEVVRQSRSASRGVYSTVLATGRRRTTSTRARSFGILQPPPCARTGHELHLVGRSSATASVLRHVRALALPRGGGICRTLCRRRTPGLLSRRSIIDSRHAERERSCRASDGAGYSTNRLTVHTTTARCSGLALNFGEGCVIRQRLMLRTHFRCQPCPRDLPRYHDFPKPRLSHVFGASHRTLIAGGHSRFRLRLRSFRHCGADG